MWYSAASNVLTLWIIFVSIVFKHLYIFFFLCVCLCKTFLFPDVLHTFPFSIAKDTCIVNNYNNNLREKDTFSNSWRISLPPFFKLKDKFIKCDLADTEENCIVVVILLSLCLYGQRLSFVHRDTFCLCNNNNNNNNNNKRL